MKIKSNFYWLPAIIVAILIALFSTILPAQGGFQKSNPSGLIDAYLVAHHSTGTTGIALDSMINTAYSGTYTPTLVMTSADTLITNHGGTYTVIDKTVTFTVSFDIAFALNTYILTSPRFSLPIPSNLTVSTTQLKGTANIYPIESVTLGITLNTEQNVGVLNGGADAGKGFVSLHGVRSDNSAIPVNQNVYRVSVTGQYPIIP